MKTQSDPWELPLKVSGFSMCLVSGRREGLHLGLRAPEGRENAWD